MAVRTYPTNDPLTNKLYSKLLAVESITATYCRKFMGTSPNSLIQIRNETMKAAGDRITIGLRLKLTGAGVIGGNTLEGNEEAFVTQDDAIIINKLRHASRVKGQGTIDQQRVPFDLREEALDDLAQWWADRQDQWFANQVTGNTGTASPENGGDVRYTGLQATVAPDEAHILRFPGDTTDADIATDGTANMSITHINNLVEQAKTLEPLIRPVNVGGQQFYVFFVHPYQLTQLRDSAGTDGSWYDIQAKAMQGGEISNNPIFTGAIGVYNQTIIHEWERLPQGSNGATSIANTRRAIFCGAQATWSAYGQGFGPGRFNWVEKLFDYDEELGVSAGCVGGLKKSRFDSKDFATLALSTYAPANATLSNT